MPKGAKMDTMNTEFWFLGIGLITSLAAIVAYFINRWIIAIDTVLEKLITVVADLNTTVALLQTNQTNATSNCVSKHLIIDNRFTSHSEKLHEHGIDITNLKVDVASLRRDIRQT